MAFIEAVGTAVPPYRVRQEEVRAAVYGMFKESLPHIDRLISVFDHSGIETRYFFAPMEWFLLDHSHKERNSLYVSHAVDLAEKAVRRCLKRANLPAEDVDHLIFVSTTGIATPSLDAHLFNRLKMQRRLKRTPIWGLGCAGGAAALSRAFEYVKAYPRHRCLVVSVELCSLTFLPDDRSKSNFVATCLFGDGAAAVLVCGEEIQTGSRHRLIAAGSTTWPNSLDVMGWEVVDDGLKVVFSKDIPSIVKREMKENVADFLDSVGIPPENIRNYVLHPGGMKVLNAYEEALQMEQGALRTAKKVLRDYGNMSSATVFFVLEEAIRSRHLHPGYGIIGALGPGFSSELLCMHTE